MQKATLILDNGAHSIKAQLVGSTDQPRCSRNSISRSKNERRLFIGQELDECTDFGNLTFNIPFDRGILTNWDTQKQVWDRLFSKKHQYGMSIEPSQTQLLVTEPVMNLPNVSDEYDQMIFEDWEFASMLRCPAPSLVPFGPAAHGPGEVQPECVLVVDSGFSFTHVVPVFRGQILPGGVRRIDVGGKLLTNHLKELVSFRQWYMMDQTSVIEHAKEECCYVTERWNDDWETANSAINNPIVRTYVLPDFVPTSSNKLGYIRQPKTGNTPPPIPDEDAMEVEGQPSAPLAAAPAEEEQLLQMGNERFTVPEVLFNPSTIDLNQAGLAESILSSIESLPEELRGMFWANIVCVGGNASFPGFGPRLRNDLRPLAPEDLDVRVTISEQPTLEAALSAQSALTRSPYHSLPDAFLTRQEYLEGGLNASRRKFGRAYWDEAALSSALGSGGADVEVQLS